MRSGGHMIRLFPPKRFRAPAPRSINGCLHKILIPSSASLHQWITCKFERRNAAGAAPRGSQAAECRGWRAASPPLTLTQTTSPRRPLTCLLSLLLSLHLHYSTRTQTAARPCRRYFWTRGGSIINAEPMSSPLF